MIKNTQFIKRLASLGLAASIALTAGTAVAEDTDLDIDVLNQSGDTKMILTFTGAGLRRDGFVSADFLDDLFEGIPIAKISCGSDLANLEQNIEFFDPDSFVYFLQTIRPVDYSDPTSDNQYAVLGDTYYDPYTGLPYSTNPEFPSFPTTYYVSDHWESGESTAPVNDFSAQDLYQLWSIALKDTTFNGFHWYVATSSNPVDFGGVFLLFDDTFGQGCADSSGGLESLLNDLDTAFNNAPLLKKGTLKALANKVEDIQSLACAYEGAEEENCVVNSVVACNRLNALENQVLALYGKQLGQEEGDSILETIYSIALDETLQCDLAN